MDEIQEQTHNLASFRKFIGTVPDTWPTFLQNRQLRLAQQERNGVAAEKVAENIVEDFFTVALDWSISDINNQLQYADIVLTNNGIKRMVVEVKRPGSLRWDHLPSIEQALSQARRYADEQRVRTIAVSDGTLFYAADILSGGLQHRVRLSLDTPMCSRDAWWVSIDGIYRSPGILDPEHKSGVEQNGLVDTINGEQESTAREVLLHPVYKVPADCFAYVGDSSNTLTWKLPYRHANGEVDSAHLPGAIRSVVTNYRGAHTKIPESAIPDVLVRLGKAAAEISKLPTQTPSPSASYQQLYDALYQERRLDEVLGLA